MPFVSDFCSLLENKNWITNQIKADMTLRSGMSCVLIFLSRFWFKYFDARWETLMWKLSHFIFSTYFFIWRSRASNNYEVKKERKHISFYCWNWDTERTLSNNSFLLLFPSSYSTPGHPPVKFYLKVTRTVIPSPFSLDSIFYLSEPVSWFPV